jgi:hypothetical protein
MADRKPKARFVVDCTTLNLSQEMQLEIAKAIQAAVLHLLATRLDTPRPALDLARAPGPSGWAGALIAPNCEIAEDLREKYQWGRPGGRPVDFFD